VVRIHRLDTLTFSFYRREEIGNFYTTDSRENASALDLVRLFDKIIVYYRQMRLHGENDIVFWLERPNGEKIKETHLTYQKLPRKKLRALFITYLSLISAVDPK
jgi:hypothetical protein